MKTNINQNNKNQNDIRYTDHQNQQEVPWKGPVVYTIIMTLFALGLLVGLLFLLEQFYKKSHEDFNSIALFIIIMFMGGAVGGCLFNIHSLVKHVGQGDFDIKHNVGYYMTPISGGVCGIIVVILLLGGVFTLNLVPDAKKEILDYPARLMPFIAAAIIAGYGSRQFKKKLDELADTLFRTNMEIKASRQEKNIKEGSLEGGVTPKVEKNQE